MELDLWLTVVGVVQDTPRAEGVPEVYLPDTQAPGGISWYLLVRTEEEPATLTAGLHENLRSGALDLRLGELRGILNGQE